MIDLEQAKKRVEKVAIFWVKQPSGDPIDAANRAIDDVPWLLTLSQKLFEKAEYQKTRISELEEPMECGHFGANLQPNDANQDICMVCGETSDLQAKLDAQQTIIDAFGSGVDAVHKMVEEIIEGRKLRKETERLEQRWGESVDLVSEVEERAQKAEGQLSSLRTELTEAKRVVFDDDTVRRLKEKIAELQEELNSCNLYRS